MSVISSKSEGYSSFLQNAAVPSSHLCCCIILVIIISYKDTTGLYGTVFTFIFVILSILTIGLTAYRYKKILQNRKVKIIAAALLLVVYGALTFFLNSRISSLVSHNHLPLYIENIPVIITEISRKRYSSEIQFRSSENKDFEIKGILYHNGDILFNRGDSVFIHKRINKISETVSGFNRKLIYRGIFYSSGIADNDITVLTRKESPFHDYLQKNILGRIDLLFGKTCSGTIKALMTGNQNYIDKKIINQYRNSGVMHCLAASGLHVAIFAAIPAIILLPFFRKKTITAVSLSFVLFYLYITDMPVSLVRAVIMFGFLFCQFLLHRTQNVFNYLMLTCSIILLYSPYELFNAGFQLSFGATAGILIFYKQYRKSLNRLPSYIADSTAITLSAQLITVPVILIQMNQINTAGLMSNIIIIPLITLIMGSAVFTIILSFASISAAAMTGHLTEFLFRISLFFTEHISDLKLNFFIQDITPMLILILFLNFIPLINYKFINKTRFYPVIISLLLCTFYLKYNYQNNQGSFTVIDGSSRADILIENNVQVLRLDVKDGHSPDKIISDINKQNPDIKIIELCNSSRSSLIASGKIMNNSAVEEFRFHDFPDISSLFKKLIFQLEKDNVVVKFKSKE